MKIVRIITTTSHTGRRFSILGIIHKLLNQKGVNANDSQRARRLDFRSIQTSEAPWKSDLFCYDLYWSSHPFRLVVGSSIVQISDVPTMWFSLVQILTIKIIQLAIMTKQFAIYFTLKKVEKQEIDHDVHYKSSVTKQVV